MSNKVDMDCDLMQRAHRRPRPPWIDACRDHMRSCDACCKKYEPYFAAIESDLQEGINTLENALDSFKALASECSGKVGIAGAGGGLALRATEQIVEDFVVYISKYKDSNIDALLWLQKVFIVSRFFESGTLCETALPKNEKRRVGDMTSSNGEKFKDITSLSYLMRHHDKNSVFPSNPELHHMIIELITSGEYYRALRLICDSPKHGVLSSILNLAVLFWDKQIYSIGFHALAQAINVFVKDYRQEYNLPA